MAVQQPSGIDGIEMRLVDYPFHWDNENLLDRLYNERDLSTQQIAEDVFDGEVSRETIRKRLHTYDLMPDEPRPSSSNPRATHDLLLSIGKQREKEKPEGDDSYEDYYRRAGGSTDAT